MTISYSDCNVKDVYLLNSRNLKFGVFTKSGTFIGLRNKFGDIFLDQELHIDRGGTATALKKICTINDNIPLAISLGVYDLKTKLMVEFDKPISDGGKGWYFVDTGLSSQDIMPCSKQNDALFFYMKNLIDTYYM